MSPSPDLIERSRPERGTALGFLFDRIDYERMQSMPYDPSRLGLDRIRQLLARLGNPHDRFPIVHVAGTKGKGSTSAMIAAALSASGLRTGLFTSPHLERIEERIALDGANCEHEELIELIERVRPEVEAIDRQVSGTDQSGPTYFEITTAMALLYFASKNADAAVLEVGLGGRLDATNVCLPAVSVITSISFDHTQQLGNTLAAIAAEKAGIVKPGVPVISGVTEPEPRDVIRRICRDRECRLIELGTDFDFDYEPPRNLQIAPTHGRLRYRAAKSSGSQPIDGEYSISLLGRHQAANAAVALAVLDQLRKAGWDLPEEAIRGALQGLAWPARVEVVSRQPTVVLDAAHNGASIAALMTTLDESFSVARRILVFATSLDKDVRGMLQDLAGKFDEVIFTRYSNNPRAMPPDRLQELAIELGEPCWPVHQESSDAWREACRKASPDDLICVTGSFFLAAEIRKQVLAGAVSPIRSSATGND